MKMGKHFILAVTFKNFFPIVVIFKQFQTKLYIGEISWILGRYI